MILVIGGHASGKRSYVREVLGYGEADFCHALEQPGPVLCDLQELVARAPGRAMDLLPGLLAREVVICDEVGCGIVPTDPGARLAREETGRLCIALARQAAKVVRLYCGIPTTIKE